MYSEVKDSGARQVFNTGAVRDTAEGKGRYDLLPTYALQRLAQHFENGAKKYGDENWRKGIPLRRFVDSALRHLMKYLEGHRDEDHAVAAAWNILALVETEEMIRRGTLPDSLDNLPSWVEHEPDTRRLPVPDLEPLVDGARDYTTGEPLEGFEKIQDEYFGNEAFNLLPNNLLYADSDDGLIDLDACGTLDGVTPLRDWVGEGIVHITRTPLPPIDLSEHSRAVNQYVLNGLPLTYNGVPLPYVPDLSHAAETARQFNAGEAYDPAARPSGRVRDWVGGTVKWLSEN